MCRVKKFNAKHYELAAADVARIAPAPPALTQMAAKQCGSPASSLHQDTSRSPLSIIMMRKSPTSTFPAVLHYMLESAEREGFAHVVSWQPHGRAFKVHDKELFTREIMPRYFRQTKFSSFNRQLNIYDFQRAARTGPDFGAYYHARMFLRGMPNLCNDIRRAGVKGSGMRRVANPELEPDFYAMVPAGLPAPPQPMMAMSFVSMPAITSAGEECLISGLALDDKLFSSEPIVLPMNIAPVDVTSTTPPSQHDHKAGTREALSVIKAHEDQSSSLQNLLSVLPMLATTTEQDFDIDAAFDSVPAGALQKLSCGTVATSNLSPTLSKDPSFDVSDMKTSEMGDWVKFFGDIGFPGGSHVDEERDEPIWF